MGTHPRSTPEAEAFLNLEEQWLCDELTPLRIILRRRFKQLREEKEAARRSPEAFRKRFARDEKRRLRQETQTVVCCDFHTYTRNRYEHSWWTHCRKCHQPLQWPPWPHERLTSP